MNAEPLPSSTRRVKLLLALLAFLALGAWIWGPSIRREIEARIVLGLESPAVSDVEEICRAYPDPVPFLNRLWNTGKVAHRRMAIEGLQRQAQQGKQDPRIEALLMEASADADASVRESALSTLAQEHSSHLVKAATAQLDNPDPQVRLLGIHYLSRLKADQALPLLVPLLDDPDLRVVATVEAAFRRWTRLDFGARIAQSIPQKQPDGKLLVNSVDLAAIRQGVAKRKAWWAEHRGEYSAVPASPVSASMPAAIGNSPVADFTLKDSVGRTWRFSDVRGKAIVLNFWATWCAPCLAEIPDLVELQNRHSNQLVVIGICLDGVPDEHGHGEVGEADRNGNDTVDAKRATESKAREDSALAAIRSRVASVIKKKGINYSVLLDPENAVGSRFNGGELPTSVLIDPAGNVRRRFVGPRPLSVWEAMIAEMLPR